VKSLRGDLFSVPAPQFALPAGLPAALRLLSSPAEIDSRFGHPEIFGSANSLMTEIIFAVLHRKVEVLRSLSWERQGAHP